MKIIVTGAAGMVGRAVVAHCAAHGESVAAFDHHTLDITDQVKAKGVVPPLGSRVGTLIAEGKAEIGVQQITELLLIPGIDFVAPLPKELQANIVYATATPTTAKEKTGAAALVKFIKSEAAVPAIKKLGLDPM